MSGGSSGNSQGQPKSQGQSQQESGKRKDQSASRPEDGEGDKKESGQDKPGEGEKPGNNQQSNQEPQPNQQGQLPEAEAGQSLQGNPQIEVWGNLPIHLRDIFRAEGGVDVPAQYRDWIDSYYRRLNRRGE